MKLYYKGVEYADIPVDDSSYLYKSIMGGNSLNVTFTLSENKQFPIGLFHDDSTGERYTLMSPVNVKKNHTKSYSYTLTLDGIQATLSRYKFKNPTDKSLKFSVTAKPKEHLAMLIKSLNQHENRWVLGDCLDAVEGVMAYNHNSCMEALNALAQEFKTEWEVENTHDGKYKIHLKKVEYNKTDPLVLSYGKGKGFLSGLSRTTESANQIEILYVQGGDRNIDASVYKSEFLLLPKSPTQSKKYLAYDGKTFYNQYTLTNLPPKALNCRLYVTDEKGVCITRVDKELASGVEASLDCSHIYPKGGGTVESVKFENKDDSLAVNCDFVGIDNIATDLDYNKERANGDNVRIIFQEGMLTGKEFDANYDHATRTFKIVPQDIDGQRMPNATFTPEVGQKYIVLGISMPEKYFCNNTERKGASWEMYREGVKYLYENETPRYSYTGTLDGVWAKRSWAHINHKIKLGGYIQFVDQELVNPESDDVLIRMTGIKQFVNNPYSPELEFTNVVVSGGVSSLLKNIDANEVIADDDRRKAFNFSKRRFNDAQETQTLLKDSLLDFSTPANPISVHTMSTLVGDESLQFRFVEFVNEKTQEINKETSVVVTIPRQFTHHIEYHKGDLDGTGSLNVPDGNLQHLTLDVDPTKQGPLAYKYWKLSAKSFSVVKDDPRHYLYARVSKTGNIPDISNPSGADNDFVFSEKAIALHAETGYYHLLVGVLNSEANGDRSYVSLYGFSELLPGRLTTGRIVSSDGQTYFDLDSGTIGGKIVFEKSDNNYVTVIKGGEINTKCINTDNLVAKKISTALSGTRIEINTTNNNAICIFSRPSGPPGSLQALAAAPGAPGGGSPGMPTGPVGESPSLIVDGNKLNALDDFRDPHGAPSSVTISDLNYSKEYNMNIPGTVVKGNIEPAYYELTGDNGFSITSDASGSLITHLPEMEFTLGGVGYGGDYGSRGNIGIEVYIDNIQLGEKRVYFNGTVEEETLLIKARSLKLGVGSHKLHVMIDGHRDLRDHSYVGNRPADRYYPVQMSASLNRISSANIQFSIVDKLTHIFANGFGSRYDTNKYFCVMNAATSDTPLVNVQGDQSYLASDGQTGLLIKNDGVFYSRNTKRSGATTNTVIQGAVPSLVYMGEVINGAIIKKWVADGLSLNSSNPSAGKVKIIMKSGVFQYASDYLVTLTANGGGIVYVDAQNKNKDWFEVNSFMIETKNIDFTFCVYNIRGMLL